MPGNVADVWRVTTLGSDSVTREPILNVFHYQITTAGTGDVPPALGAGFDAVGGIFEQLTGVLPTGVKYQYIALEGVAPQTVVTYYSPTHTAGVIAGVVLPGQTAAILTRKTARPGRGGRGRLFVGPIPLGFQDPVDFDRIVPTKYTALAAAVVTAIASLGYTFVPVIYHRVPKTTDKITACTINPLIKTRRSRAEGTRFHRRKRRTVGSIPPT